MKNRIFSFLENIISDTNVKYKVKIDVNLQKLSKTAETMHFDDYADLILKSLDYVGEFLVYEGGWLVKTSGLQTKLRLNIDISDKANVEFIKRRGIVHAYFNNNMLVAYDGKKIINYENFSKFANAILSSKE